jgi:hypothetical protein
MNTVMKRIEERFSDNELQILENILNVTANELMPEVDQKKAETLQDVSAQ